MIEDTAIPVTNPAIALREDFDGWAVLYNPDTAAAFGINPVSAALWRRIDGRCHVSGLIAGALGEFRGAPSESYEQLRAFLALLLGKGLISVVPSR